MKKRLYLSLLLLLGFSTTIFGQRLESRYHLGIHAGSIEGLDVRYFATRHLAFDVAVGYFPEGKALSSQIFLEGHLPLDVYGRKGLYAGLGYSLNSRFSDELAVHDHGDNAVATPVTAENRTFLSLHSKIGYRQTFENSPFSISLDWQPWMDGIDHFHLMGGSLSLQYGFRSSRKSRTWRREALNGYYTRAIGLMLGMHNGITFKNFISPRVALQFQAYHRSFGETFNVAAFFSYNQPLGMGLFLVGGLGGGYHLVEAKLHEDFSIHSHYQGLLGLEYNFFGQPFTVGVQWMPHYSALLGVDIFEATLAVRYTLGSNY